ncbi:alpha/beta hydrolase [Pseudoalteromonas sp. C2R02]|uniref:alpha/beta hydrolase n=1 Tax=Pseudoalteromonas sp. C2R02 TaxID=2841565 RepID=UPI001C083B62|nr:alpha/beta hydrolase-fold protein [Pseudoalteromonas sp. C2R02]MBU2970942.1 alpha/beta hydrolase [Pseudoalteromonas sp. C2R02]
MKKILIFLFLLPFFNVGASEHKLYSIPGTQVIPIKDTISNKQYELLIKLPNNYEKNKDKNYPVVYFTDAVEHIELLSSASYMIWKDVILVGISWQKDISEDLRQQYGVHVSRYMDYTFKKTVSKKHPKIKFGLADKHLAFIRKDVFKFVESNYRTEPNNRTYFGFSAGGVFGVYALMTQPDSFKNYILGSPLDEKVPTLFAQEHAALKNTRSAINVLTSYGELEEEVAPFVEDFVSQLNNKKYKGIASINNIIAESYGHSDSSPLVAAYGMRWLKSLQAKSKE